MTAVLPAREEVSAPALDYIGIMYSNEAPGTVDGPFASAKEAHTHAKTRWMLVPGHLEYTLMVYFEGAWHDLQGRDPHAAWSHRWSRDVVDRTDAPS